MLYTIRYSMRTRTYFVLLIITINVIIITMPSLLSSLSSSLLISHPIITIHHYHHHPSIYPPINASINPPINASISSNQRCSEGVHERSHRRRLLGGLSSLLAATTDAQGQWHHIRLVGNIDRWIE